MYDARVKKIFDSKVKKLQMHGGQILENKVYFRYAAEPAPRETGERMQHNAAV